MPLLSFKVCFPPCCVDDVSAGRECGKSVCAHAGLVFGGQWGCWVQSGGRKLFFLCM